MDSLNVGPQVLGYVRNGNIRPLDVGRHFQQIFDNFIEFITGEPTLYPETSVFGVVPPPVDSWEARTMDTGFPKHAKMRTKHYLLTAHR
jgi:hypothetical protein